MLKTETTSSISPHLSKSPFHKAQSTAYSLLASLAFGKIVNEIIELEIDIEAGMQDKELHDSLKSIVIQDQEMIDERWKEIMTFLSTDLRFFV